MADPVQRRLAAILAADVAGYSRLMGENEEGTLAALTAHRTELIEPCITEHRGRVVKTTGDGLLAEFASVVDAVRCAVAVQDGMRVRNAEIHPDHHIKFRIGVNLGDVIVQDDDVYGDGVNVAARLEGLAEPGGICVSAKVHDEVKARLDLAFEDLGDQQVKNITRPVRVYAVTYGDGTSAVGGSPAAERASIAVLPFSNMSGDPEQEYFSDGISEDIITALSRARWFRVVSRNSAFAYKGMSHDVRKIAKDLGVRYVLEGSVRKAGSRVRITAQLIDGATDDHLWAERYDRELADIFEVQDEITGAIAAQIEPELRRAEFSRTEIARPENLNVWDVYQRGMWHMYRKKDPDNLAAADHFRRAAEMDPTFGPAWSGIAHACFFLVHFDRVNERDHYIEEGMQAAQRAVDLDRESPDARFALAQMQGLHGNYEEALAEGWEAVRLNPLGVAPRMVIGRILVNQGRYAEAVDAMLQGIGISPNENSIGILMSRLAEAYFHLHEYEKAIDWMRRADRESVAPRMWGRATLVAALGHANDLDGAQRALRDVLESRPNFSLGYVRDHYPVKAQGAVEHMVDGLRKAGVPE